MPYWGYFGLVRLVASFIPLRVANELVIGAILISLPAALAFALARHGRSPALALIAVPLAWSYDLALGFVSYVEGVALLFVAIGALASPPARVHGRWLAGHMALGVAIYFCHPLAFLLWLLALLVWAPRRGPLVAAPALALFVYAFATSPGRHGDGLAASTFAARWLSPLATVKVFPERVLDFVGNRAQYGLLALLVGTLAALALITTRGGATSVGDRRPWWFAGALLVLAFALPEHLLRPINWWQLSGRLPLVVVLALPLCLPRARLGRAAWLLAPAVVASAIYVGAIVTKFRAFDRRADDFHAVVAALPMAPDVLTLIYPPLGEPGLRVDAWREFPSYVQVARGGYNPWSWPDGFPMRTRPEAVRAAPPAAHAEQFDWDAHAGPFEWFLVRGAPQRLFAGRPVTQVASRGDWTLWRKPLTRK